MLATTFAGTPVFLITAYDQETETPHIKAFLRRTGHALPRRPAGR